MKKALRGFGLFLVLLLLAGAVAVWRNPPKPGSFHGGLQKPVLALELVRTVEHVRQVEQYYGAQQWQAKSQRGLCLDSIAFIPFYGALLLALSLLLLCHQFRHAKLLGGLALLGTLVAVGFDYRENHFIWQVLQNWPNGVTEELLARVWRASVVKWAAVFIAIGLLAGIFLWRRHWTIVLGLLYLAGALTGLVGVGQYLLQHPHYAAIEYAFLPLLAGLLLTGLLFALAPHKVLEGIETPPAPVEPPVPLFKVLLEEYALQQRTHGLPDLTSEQDRPGHIENLIEQFDQVETTCAEIQEEAQRAVCIQAEKDRLNQELVTAIYRQLHKLAGQGHKRVAICFSGGGIRSATFGLGLLQGLAQHFSLDQLYYASTVSGGGYLGSWLSAWIHRRGLSEVQGQLKFGDANQMNKEPEPIQHLRRYSNYMSPKLGLLSADTWTLVAIYLRNLLLNWSVLLPLLICALALPRLNEVLLHAAASGFGTGWGEFVIAAALLLSLCAGALSIAYIVVNRPSLEGQLKGSERHRIPNNEAGFLCWGLLPLVVAAILASAFWAWTDGRGRTLPELADGLIWGILHLAPPDNANIVGTAVVAMAQRLVNSWLGFVPLVVLLYAFGWLWGQWVKWFFKREFIRPNWLTALITGLVIVACNYLLQQGPAGAFLVFGITFNCSGVLFAYAWRRLHFADYIFSIIVGAGGGLCLWLVAQHFFPQPVSNAKTAALFACFAVPLFLLMYALAATLYVGLTSYITTDADREWLARAGAWVLITVAVWCVAHGIVFFGPLLWSYAWQYLLSLGGVSGLLTLVVGWSAKSAATQEQTKQRAAPAGWQAWLGRIATLLAAPIFLLFVLILLAVATSWLIFYVQFGGQWDRLYFAEMQPHWHLNLLYRSSWLTALGVLCVPFLVAMITGLFVNVNKFSLHSAYRDRLIRAYLGASRRAIIRNPNPFTGMDERDNLQMHELPVAVFARDSFRDLDGLIQTIVDAQRAGEPAASDAQRDKKLLARFIFSSLTQATQQQLLQHYPPSAAPAVPAQANGCEPARSAFIGGLNQLVRGALLCTEDTLEALLTTPSPSGERARGLFSKMLFDTAAPQQVCARELEKQRAHQAMQQAEAEQIVEPPRDKLATLRALVAAQPVIPSFWQRFGGKEQRAYVERLAINRELLALVYDEYFNPMPKFTPEARPLHVINIALNLVAGKELAWQERKAESFTVSALHAGSARLGYRKSTPYAVNRRVNGALTLGTSLAISGAAASPNMGYHSSPVVTFLLGLFNVRLGWWLGNPGRAGAATAQLSSPYFAPWPLIAEPLGLTDEEHRYVYLSDGGHFENLGLYEMVRRRCRYIIVSDGGADPQCSFEDLGNAIRKIYIDLGVPIVFEELPIRRREADPPAYDARTKALNDPRKYCAVGRICYSAVDSDAAEPQPEKQDGLLLYIKPAFYGTEPADVYNYAIAHPTFPHETTADQLYSESQFESYRALGQYVIQQIIRGNEKEVDFKDLKPEELFERARLYLGKSADYKPPAMRRPSKSKELRQQSLPLVEGLPDY